MWKKNALISTRRVRKLTSPCSTGSDHPEEKLIKYTSVLDKYGLREPWLHMFM